MRLESYLLTEGRTRPINERDVIKLIQGKHSDAWKRLVREYSRRVHGTGHIFRGVRGKPSEYVYGHGRGERPRKSANTYNYSTLFFDNSSMWSKFPKRSESFVCSTDIGKSSGYGSLYHVLPENGEKIGVCSDRDIFTSFPKTLGFAYVGEVNDIIWQILETAGVSTRVDDSWDTFNDANELVENYFYKNENKLEKIQDEIKIQGIKAPFEGDIIEWMYKIYDPKKNGFQIKKSGELLPTDREVWMSGNCLFINADNFPYFYDDHEELTVGVE